MSMMIGIDEVGRGAWAGPLLVVAVRQKGPLPPGMTDSKLLSPPRRQRLALAISQSCDVGHGWVDAYELDQLGLAQSLRIATARALAVIGAGASDEIIIDGKVNLAPPAFTKVSTVVDADNNVPVVSAASIVAKATRDAVMKQIADFHPGYNFENNVGYGTQKHRDALALLGPVIGLHRLSFKPVSEVNSD